MNLHSILARATAATTQIGTDIRPEQLDLPTPCPGIDVRHLLNHTLIACGFVGELAGNRRPKPTDGSLDQERDFITGDWADLFATQLDKAVQAWADPTAWAGTTPYIGTELVSSYVGSLLIAEVVLHGWDLAVATGQQLRCDDEVTTALTVIVAQMEADGRKYGFFNAPVAVPASASPLDRALAQSGRDPAWKA